MYQKFDYPDDSFTTRPLESGMIVWCPYSIVKIEGYSLSRIFKETLKIQKYKHSEIEAALVAGVGDRNVSTITGLVGQTACLLGAAASVYFGFKTGHAKTGLVVGAGAYAAATQVGVTRSTVGYAYRALKTEMVNGDYIITPEQMTLPILKTAVYSLDYEQNEVVEHKGKLSVRSRQLATVKYMPFLVQMICSKIVRRDGMDEMISRIISMNRSSIALRADDLTGTISTGSMFLAKILLLDRFAREEDFCIAPVPTVQA
jgi:hypothetical protein